MGNKDSQVKTFEFVVSLGQVLHQTHLGVFVSGKPAGDHVLGTALSSLTCRSGRLCRGQWNLERIV